LEEPTVQHIIRWKTGPMFKNTRQKKLKVSGKKNWREANLERGSRGSHWRFPEPKTGFWKRKGVRPNQKKKGTRQVNLKEAYKKKKKKKKNGQKPLPQPKTTRRSKGARGKPRLVIQKQRTSKNDGEFWSRTSKEAHEIKDTEEQRNIRCGRKSQQMGNVFTAAQARPGPRKQGEGKLSELPRVAGIGGEGKKMQKEKGDG